MREIYRVFTVLKWLIEYKNVQYRKHRIYINNNFLLSLSIFELNTFFEHFSIQIYFIVKKLTIILMLNKKINNKIQIMQNYENAATEQVQMQIMIVARQLNIFLHKAKNITF